MSERGDSHLIFNGWCGDKLVVYPRKIQSRIGWTLARCRSPRISCGGILIVEKDCMDGRAQMGSWHMWHVRRRQLWRPALSADGRVVTHGTAPGSHAPRFFLPGQ